MITICLNNLLFFAHHGLHDDETVVGTEFELNITVGFLEEGKIGTIKETINYVHIYDIIKEHMKRPSRLLETVVMDMADDIHKIDPRIRTINISISKLNPPINNFTGKVGVIYNKEFL